MTLRPRGVHGLRRMPTTQADRAATRAWPHLGSGRRAGRHVDRWGEAPDLPGEKARLNRDHRHLTLRTMFDISGMSTADQTLSSGITGEALLRRRALRAATDHRPARPGLPGPRRPPHRGRRQDGRRMVRQPCGRATMGLRTHAAGMLLVGGIHDGDQLKQAVLEGWERRPGSFRGYGPGF